jgi:hypothetical protein
VEILNGSRFVTFKQLGNGSYNSATANGQGIVFSNDSDPNTSNGGFSIVPWSSVSGGIQIFENGNVGIGTASPSYKLDVSGDMRASNYYVSSDRRLKDAISDFRNEGLAVVGKIRSVHFTWKADGRADIGVIAQEVEAILPKAVTTGTDGFKAVAYEKLVLPVIEAVKELHAMVKDLQATIADLLEWQSTTDKRLKAMEDRLDALTRENDELRAKLEAKHAH